MLVNDTDGTLSDIETAANNPEFSKAPDSSDGGSKGNDARSEKTDDKQPSSMEEAVQQALDARIEAEKAEDSSSSEAESEEAPAQEDSQLDENGDKKEPSEDEKLDGEEDKEEKSKDKEKDDESRFDKHPRWQEMQRKVAEYEPLAKWAQNDQAFRQKYGIQDDEHKDLMEFGALMHANPEQALVQAKQFVEKMELSLGKVLPKDLQADVDEGKIPVERAKEIAALRLQKEVSTVQAKQSEQAAQQQSQTAIVQSLNQWDSVARRKDADFKPKVDDKAPDGKFELVFKEIQRLAMQNPPRNGTEAVALAEKAYADVAALFKRFSPSPRSRRSISQHNGSFATTNGKEPKNMREAIQQNALRKHGLRFVSEED